MRGRISGLSGGGGDCTSSGAYKTKKVPKKNKDSPSLLFPYVVGFNDTVGENFLLSARELKC